MSRLYTGLRKTDPNYYNKRRALRMAYGLCEKCPEELYRSGLCKKHYLANLTTASRVQQRKTSRKNTCQGCGEKGHNVGSCKLRQSMG